MSGSLPIPTPVPARDTIAKWKEEHGAGWVTRERDGKLFPRPGRAARSLVLTPPGPHAENHSAATIRALERQINGGRELSPPYEPKAERVAPTQEHPEPVSGSVSQVTTQITAEG